MITARHTTNRQSFKKVTCPFKAILKTKDKRNNSNHNSISSEIKRQMLPSEMITHLMKKSPSFNGNPQSTRFCAIAAITSLIHHVPCKYLAYFAVRPLHISPSPSPDGRWRCRDLVISGGITPYRPILLLAPEES